MKLEGLIQKGAGVAFDERYIFRDGKEGFERINLACSRSALQKALNMIGAAITDK